MAISRDPFEGLVKRLAAAFLLIYTGKKYVHFAYVLGKFQWFSSIQFSANSQTKQNTIIACENILDGNVKRTIKDVFCKSKNALISNLLSRWHQLQLKLICEEMQELQLVNCKQAAEEQGQKR